MRHCSGSIAIGRHGIIIIGLEFFFKTSMKKVFSVASHDSLATACLL